MKIAADPWLYLKLMAILLEMDQNLYWMISFYWNCLQIVAVLFVLKQEHRYGEIKWGHRFSNSFTEAKILVERYLN